jgi:hypothetical protein
MARRKSADQKPKRSAAKTKAVACDATPADVKRAVKPTKYSNEEAERICDWIASGKSLRSYCKLPGTPTKSTVLHWRSTDKAFADQYARAREEQADTHAEEILEIADNQELDPNARRVMIDARKWIASKLKPKVYGDKLQADVSGTVTLEQLVLGSYKTEAQG